MTGKSTLMVLILSAGAAWAGYTADRLSRMDEATRKNALIELEWAGPHTDAMTEAEFLWNTGKYDGAISAVEALESELGDMCLGISWRKPIETQGPKWGTDVQVTNSLYATSKVELVKAVGNNNLFVLAYGAGDTQWNYSWWVYMSTNGGLSWSETYSWGAAYCFYTADAAEFSNGYVYITYGSGTDVRVRRVDENTGLVDNGFGYKVVYTTADTVLEANIEPNRYNGSQLYVSSIDRSGALRYAFSDAQGSTWTSADPSISDAAGGLDMDYGYMNGAQHLLWLSYLNTANKLCAAARTSGAWELHTNLDGVYGAYPSTAIAMRGDTVLVASTRQVSGNEMYVIYYITYDDGNNWYGNAPVGTTDSTNHPDVTPRGDQGWQMAYIEYHTSGPEHIGYTTRTYSSGTWSTPVFLSEHDAFRWCRPSIDYLGTANAYGVVYIDDAFISWFDRKDWSDVVENQRPLPMEFKAMPGPGRTTLSFVLPQDGFASLKIYDVKGALVRDLSGRYRQGLNMAEFAPPASGTYFAVLVVGDQTARTRFVSVK
jgi:hypothetical protein